MKKIETEHILTLGFIESSLNKSYERLKVDINTLVSEKAQLDIFNAYSSISEVLLWINANNEWQYINNNSLYLSQDKFVIDGVGETFGLRHAFNLLKHDMSHINLFTIQTSDSNDDGDINNFSEEVIWLNCPDATRKKHEEGVKDYREFLKGKNVFQSISKSITFLNKMNYNIRFNNK